MSLRRPPAEPTRINTSAPTLRNSSKAMAADEPPIPVEHTLTGTPFVLPLKTTYSRFSAIKRASSSSAAMRCERAPGHPAIVRCGRHLPLHIEYAFGLQLFVSSSWVTLSMPTRGGRVTASPLRKSDDFGDFLDAAIILITSLRLLQQTHVSRANDSLVKKTPLP